jgi:uncharacterized Zn finger protein
MTCTRCQGCMAEDHFLDLMETGGEMWIRAWRCLNCGNVLDHVMEQNRAHFAGQHLVTHVSISVNEADAGLVGKAASLPRAA